LTYSAGISASSANAYSSCLEPRWLRRIELAGFVTVTARDQQSLVVSLQMSPPRRLSRRALEWK